MLVLRAKKIVFCEFIGGTKCSFHMNQSARIFRVDSRAGNTGFRSKSFGLTKVMTSLLPGIFIVTEICTFLTMPTSLQPLFRTCIPGLNDRSIRKS